ncbi:MAG: DUF6636 domain-containing protein [Pseudomonadota bacterium]
MAILAGPATAEVQHFQSPSGNIRCMVSDQIGDVVRCDLGVDEQSYTDRPATCDGDWGTSFGVLAQGPGFLNCVTNRLAGGEEHPVLPYGGTLEVSGITCRSEPTGMTCTNAEGGGFFVRRSEQRVF